MTSRASPASRKSPSPHFSRASHASRAGHAHAAREARRVRHATGSNGPARRRQEWAGLSAVDVLAGKPPGRTPPLQVLEVLLTLFNEQHTARHKSVSHKTRHDRAVFLRRCFHDLQGRAGFATIPDPRNLGGRHVQAMVDLWRSDRLAAATIQTYLSFLRGLAGWIGKPGLVRKPAAYGLDMAQYQRHEVARRDRTWSAAGIAIEPLIEEICAYDIHVGAALRLIHAFGLRRKEAVMMRPHVCVVPFGATGIAPERRKAEFYLWVCQGSKGGRPRYLPIATDEQARALTYAQEVTPSREAHMSRPGRDLRQNLNRFSYVMRRFGLSLKERGVTGHGLRHEALVAVWIEATGVAPPIRGGPTVAREIGAAARLDIAELAGHARRRAASAYIGSSRATGVTGVTEADNAVNADNAANVDVASGDP